MMNLLQEHFRRSAEVLAKEFERSKTSRSTVSRGRAREIFIGNFLAQHLPARLKIGRGEIVDCRGRSSGEQDIILYRDDIPKLHVAESDVFLVEGVYATIQVKSTLNKKTFYKAMDSIRSVKELQRIAPKGVIAVAPFSPRISCHIFAYTGSPLHTILGYLDQYKEKHPSFDGVHSGFDSLCILDQGCIPSTLETHAGGKEVRGYTFGLGVTHGLLVFFFKVLQDAPAFGAMYYDLSPYWEEF